MLRQLTPIVISSGITSSTPSGTLELKGATTLGIEAAWPASLQGTISITTSLMGLLYQTIPNSTVTLTGTAGGQVWNYQNCGFSRMQVSFTPTSGSGTITVAVDPKGSH